MPIWYLLNYVELRYSEIKFTYGILLELIAKLRSYHQGLQNGSWDTMVIGATAAMR